MIASLIAELVLLLAAVALAWWGADAAITGALANVGEPTGPTLRTAIEVQAATQTAVLHFSLGVLAMALGRVVGVVRGKGNIPTPLLLPAATAAAALGLMVQTGYGNPLTGPGWPGPGFGEGVAYGGVAAGLLLALPWDPIELFTRARRPLLLFIFGTFAVLAVFGTGPDGTSTRINLGPIQPLEAVKVAFVAYLSVFLGQRAVKLRYQRERAGFLVIPRPKLLVQAVAVLALLFGGLLFVKDLGPTLILSLVFLAMFYVVTRSPGWVLVALVVVAVGMGLLALDPDLLGSATLAKRVDMWLHPWLNGRPGGDQLAASRWAIAAGGMTGQGLGFAHIGALPAGHTDLAIATLCEVLGAPGVWLYLCFLGLVALQGLWIAATNRTPERMLLGTGLSLLVLAQWAVIFGGTTGALPLTGVVAPFLSSGKSSMAAFFGVVGLLGRLAESGSVRVASDELQQLRGGVVRAGGAVPVLLSVAGTLVFHQAVTLGPRTTARGVVTTLADGTVKLVYDRRLTELVLRVRRGEILDRNGEVLAGTAEDGSRTYPLGPALGTLLGPPSDEVLRPTWTLERRLDPILRGYPELDDGPATWLVQPPEGGKEQLLFAVSSREEKPADRERAHELAIDRYGPQATVRLLPRPAPDFSAFVPLVRTTREQRETGIAEIADDVASRSVQLTLDARLQRKVADEVKAAAGKSKVGTAAAVVVDVDTGEVLARAQYPDYDPTKGWETWHRMLLSGDKKYTGSYGPIADKTGIRGTYQAGSVAKLFTALAGARAGLQQEGRRCEARGVQTFSCTEHDEKGPLFDHEGWEEPIHDFHKDQNHGTIEISEALQESCNVWFAQYGLQLGPQPFVDLQAAGVDIGLYETFEPGAAESRKLASTAFGQGASALNVSQAARLGATIASGGVYRQCSPDMVLGQDCVSTEVVGDPDDLAPILAGMRKVVDAGTARKLSKLDGVRVYGKTGTADDAGRADEAPWGIRRHSHQPAHSWFIAIAEPGAADPCEPQASGRLAVAAVVPRGGFGATTAGPLALNIVGAANDLSYFSVAAPPAEEGAAAEAP